jgi:hypothetical protein
VAESIMTSDMLAASTSRLLYRTTILSQGVLVVVSALSQGNKRWLCSIQMQPPSQGFQLKSLEFRWFVQTHSHRQKDSRETTGGGGYEKCKAK